MNFNTPSGKTISFRTYLDKRSNPKIDEVGNQRYPLYVQITYKRKSNQFPFPSTRTDKIPHAYYTEKELENTFSGHLKDSSNDYYKKLFLLFVDFIKFKIEVGGEKNFTLKGLSSLLPFCCIPDVFTYNLILNNALSNFLKDKLSIIHFMDVFNIEDVHNISNPSRCFALNYKKVRLKYLKDIDQQIKDSDLAIGIRNYHQLVESYFRKNGANNPKPTFYWLTNEHIANTIIKSIRKNEMKIFKFNYDEKIIEEIRQLKKRFPAQKELKFNTSDFNLMVSDFLGINSTKKDPFIKPGLVNEKKITIKHYLNTRLKPIGLSLNPCYPVYTNITYNRRATSINLLKEEGIKGLTKDDFDCYIIHGNDEKINTQVNELSRNVEAIIKHEINHYKEKFSLLNLSKKYKIYKMPITEALDISLNKQFGRFLEDYLTPRQYKKLYNIRPDSSNISVTGTFLKNYNGAKELFLPKIDNDLIGSDLEKSIFLYVCFYHFTKSKKLNPTCIDLLSTVSLQETILSFIDQIYTKKNLDFNSYKDPANVENIQNIFSRYGMKTFKITDCFDIIF